jgi:hypothetical protein
VPGFHQTWRLAFRPKSSVLVSSDQRIFFLMLWESFRCFLANSKRAVKCLMSGFCLVTLPQRPDEWLLSCHSTTKAWLVDCCRNGCPSGRFSHLHRGTLESLSEWPLGSWLPSWPRPFSPEYSVWPGGQL